MRDYSKFSAIIIGAGVSTGSAITRKFAEMGYRVCPVRRERNFSELEKLANGIKEAGYSATPFGVDARDEDAIAKLFKEVEENIAPIDVVVFNPGANVFFPIEETTARVYKKVWEMAAFAGFLTGKRGCKIHEEKGAWIHIFHWCNCIYKRGCRIFCIFRSKVCLKVSFSKHGKRTWSARHSCRPFYY